jgi:hypothetical protein
VPTLPSTTAALRANPRRFARFIALPLKRALNSACDMVTSSRATVRASGESNPSRDASAGSINASANLMFHGQTSWEVCRYTRLEIPLGTGSGTLRKTTSER